MMLGMVDTMMMTMIDDDNDGDCDNYDNDGDCDTYDNDGDCDNYDNDDNEAKTAQPAFLPAEILLLDKRGERGGGIE